MRKLGGFGRFAGAAATLALAGMATACSNSQSPVAPAGLGGSLDVSGGTVRYFTSAFTGGNSVAASTATSFTLIITNHSSTSANQDLGYAEVAIPGGFTTTTTGTVTASGSKSWSASVAGSTIQVRANSPEGQNRLVPGESVSVVINTTAPSTCDTYTFTTVAFKEPPAGTPFTLLAGTFQPTVVVTNCGDVCTLGQGYWKNHPEAWPVQSLTLGTVAYDQTQLLSILGQQVQGNGLVSLAHQLIAAKLNVARGSDDSAIASSIAAADALIGSLVVPPVGSGSLDPSTTGALNTALTNYNEGVTGPGACSIAGS